MSVHDFMFLVLILLRARALNRGAESMWVVAAAVAHTGGVDTSFV